MKSFITKSFFVIGILLSQSILAHNKEQSFEIFANQQQTISVQRYQLIHLYTPSNPSTGYTWTMLVTEPYLGCFKVLKDGVLKDSMDSSNSHTVPMPGAPKMQEWVIQSKCIGDYTLDFQYIRPWEKNIAPVQTMKVHLIVK